MLFMKSAMLFTKSATFHEKHSFAKDHLQGIVTLCFQFFGFEKAQTQEKPIETLA